MQDGQIVVQDSTPTTQRTVKETQPILVQRRTEDTQNTNSVTNQNIGVITQGTMLILPILYMCLTYIFSMVFVFFICEFKCT